jgi:hypothetical protein
MGSVHMEKKTKLYALIIIGVVVILILTYFFTPKAYRTSIPATMEHPQTILEEWREFRSPTERFHVSLPTAPQRATESFPVPSSDEHICYDLVLSQAKSGTICMVNIIDYPPSVDVSRTDYILENAIKAMVANNQANHLEKSEKGTFYGFPGMDFIIVNQDATIYGREFLKGRSLFVMSVADHDAKAAETVFKRLAESFSLSE